MEPYLKGKFMEDIFQKNSESLLHQDKLVFPNQSILFAEGEQSNYLYIIKEGIVLLLKNENKKLKKLEVLGPQDIIGLNSLIKDCLHENTAISLSKVELMKIKKTEVNTILSKCAPWISDLLKVISQRLETTYKIINEHNIEEDLYLDKETHNFEESRALFLLDDYLEQKGLSN